MTTFTERIAGLNGFIAYKPPVRAATTANIALSGEQTIDGVAVVSGDRVLVKNQTAGLENGIYVVATSAWSRSKDFNGARDVMSGTQVLVTSGTVNGGHSFRITTADDITIGTTAIAFALSGTETKLYDTRSDVTTASVPAAVQFIRTAGYATVGDGGAALYDKVSAEPSHNLKVQSADGAWWELVFDQAGMSPYQAGAVGDDATDDSQAFVDLFGYLKLVTDANGNTAMPRILVNGEFYLGSTTLEPRTAINMLGVGSGLSGVKGSKLRWDANVTGIIIHRENTTGATTGSNLGAADGSIIDGVELVSGGGTIAGITDDTLGHGIWLRARAVLRNVVLDGFPGNGVQILATSGGAAAVEGNANNWAIENLRAKDNHLSGLRIDGADANAGVSINVDAVDNGRAGLWDSSSLGNLHQAGHTSGNGYAGQGENSSSESHFVHYNGPGNGNTDRRYIANVDATEADLVATEPGTDASVWIDVESGTSSGTVPTWQASQPEGTYFHGGPYLTTNTGAQNLLLNCYIENGFPQYRRPTTIIAGHRQATRAQGTFALYAAGVNEGAFIGKHRFDDDLELNAALNHDGTTAGFYGSSPVAQHSATGETTGFTAGSGTSANDDSTYTGNVGSTAYTVSDVVKALKNLGLMAP